MAADNSANPEEIVEWYEDYVEEEVKKAGIHFDRRHLANNAVASEWLSLLRVNLEIKRDENLYSIEKVREQD